MQDVPALALAQALAYGDLASLEEKPYDAEYILQLILTFLPTSTDPASYVSLLEQVSRQDASASDASKGHGLNLLPLAPPSLPHHVEVDHLTLFLLHRSYQIDAELGSLSQVQKLVRPFTATSSYLRKWISAVLEPAIHARYHTAAFVHHDLKLEDLARLDVSEALDLILERDLSHAWEVADVIHNVFAPWTTQRNRNDAENAWKSFYAWLFRLHQKNRDHVISIFKTWPREEVPFRNLHERSGLACIWAENGPQALGGVRQILTGVKGFGSDADLADELVPDDFQSKNLNVPDNCLTTSCRFAEEVLGCAERLCSFRATVTMTEIAKLSLFADQAEQLSWLRTFLAAVNLEKCVDDECSALGHLILELRQSRPKVLGKTSAEDVEMEILTALITAGHYSLAQSVCVVCERSEKIVIEAVLALYDTASDGNRTHGNVKKASVLIETFSPKFPTSEGLARMKALLSATHAMSFYSSNLQPAAIRQQDPMHLIEIILRQNPRSYTHLDDMISIGQRLHEANPTGAEMSIQRHVEQLAIRAALAEDDFDTAYSYIVNRLHDHADNDNVSWRAAFAAGQYAATVGSSTYLRRLEQRMEILSQALLMAPAAAIADLLTVWKACEQDMANLLAEETSPDASPQFPGGFASQDDTRPTVDRSGRHEDAPMGLFDVARGAASALSKNAFLHNPAMQTDEQGERIRKRDMVSNLVTGGLASGIGWVIGTSRIVGDQADLRRPFCS